MKSILTIKDYYNDFISRTEKYKNLSYSDYKKLFSIYYRKVMDYLVDGKGIRLPNGMGVLFVEYNELDNEKLKVIDWGATKRRKKEVIENGGKPYDSNEAKEYERAGITYDGIDCIVYKSNNYKMTATIINTSNIFGSKISFSVINNTPIELRGLSYKDISEKISDNRLSYLKYNFRARCEIEVLRDRINYLRYVHKMK